jgi:hypothetical protein
MADELLWRVQVNENFALMVILFTVLFCATTVVMYDDQCNHAETLFSKWRSRSIILSISGSWSGEIPRLHLQHLSSYFSRKK